MTFEERPTSIMAAAGFFLWFLMLSAALVETDAYRFSAIIVAGYGIWVYHRTRPQPGISLMAWYCIFWAQYVIVRFLYGYFDSDNFEHGSSEWLFAFPLFFGGIGIGLTRMRFHVEKMLLFFFAVAALLLAASQHWWVMASGRAVSPLYHNNQIPTQVINTRTRGMHGGGVVKPLYWGWGEVFCMASEPGVLGSHLSEDWDVLHFGIFWEPVSSINSNEYLILVGKR